MITLHANFDQDCKTTIWSLGKNGTQLRCKRHQTMPAWKGGLKPSPRTPKSHSAQNPLLSALHSTLAPLTGIGTFRE
jgi:hypothetical protein